MSGAIVDFPERTYRPDIDMLANLMPDLADADLVVVVEMMMRVVRAKRDEAYTPRNCQAVVDSLAIAYLTLGRFFGELQDAETEPTAGHGEGSTR